MQLVSFNAHATDKYGWLGRGMQSFQSQPMRPDLAIRLGHQEVQRRRVIVGACTPGPLPLLKEYALYWPCISVPDISF
jgi:hypothetical protein